MDATRSLWPRWVLANALGEAIGLGAVGAAGVLAYRAIGMESAAAAVAMALVAMALGSCEGFIVGFAQWWALARALPAIGPRTWIGRTVLGAVAAWALGMLPSTVMHILGAPGEMAAPTDGPAPSPPSPLVVTFAAAGLGLVAGPILAAFQRGALRPHVRGSGWWLPANAAAWALGMPLVFVAVRVEARATLGALSPLLALALLLLAGAVVGAVHGAVLARLVRGASVAPPTQTAHPLAQGGNA